MICTFTLKIMTGDIKATVWVTFWMSNKCLRSLYMKCSENWGCRNCEPPCNFFLQITPEPSISFKILKLLTWVPLISTHGFCVAVANLHSSLFQSIPPPLQMFLRLLWSQCHLQTSKSWRFWCQKVFGQWHGLKIFKQLLTVQTILSPWKWNCFVCLFVLFLKAVISKW